ncbi:MAG: phosphatidylserine/phosphatidylglycerophosphate/cardiolipin synthase family protein [Bacteroidales bacterium]|nr:phosphatidylserine/phosphatidylglycerophosphate/cardiolipin synthase family protein [Bacteroidales bacterium]
MMVNIQEPYQIFDDMMLFYNSLLADIDNAKKTIYIEVFKFHDDHFSKRILAQITKAVQRGVHTKILVDGWGTPHANTFFKEFVESGGLLRIWDKAHITFNWDVIIKSHHRDHRKIFTIDNKISYIGSANISDYNLAWRELMLRSKDVHFAQKLSRIIHYQFVAAKTIIMPQKKRRLGSLFTENFEIVRDIPSTKRSLVKKRYIELINQAKKNIFIESPYFLPSSSLRFAMEKAIARGVKIVVITPKHSDVKAVDILRDRYIAPLYEMGADIRLFKPNNLHAKLLMIDSKIFSIGSSNFDYRSFRHQYEIVAIGQQSEIIQQLQSHIYETLEQSESFDMEHWTNRSRWEKFKEHLIIPIRSLL